MHRISRSLTYHCDAFRDSDRRRPKECSRWQRDRVAVLRRVMQSLYIRCRSVGLVNGRPAAQGEQAAENKDKPKDFSRHNCGLPILAMRRRRCSYQSQLSWQVKFFLFWQFISQGFLYESQTK